MKKILFLIVLSMIFMGISSFVVWDIYVKDNVSGTSNIKTQTTDNQQNAPPKKPVIPETTDKTNQNSTIPINRTVNSSAAGSSILGRPTNSSIAVNILATKGMEAFLEYGNVLGTYSHRTDAFVSKNGDPIEIEINNLEPDTTYYYRVNYRQLGAIEFVKGVNSSFNTARPQGGAFVFAVQGDSHPERLGKMFNADLYTLTMDNVGNENPDFYLTIGDDYSIESLIEKKTLSQESVDSVYLSQRKYLGIIGSSAPLFLVNGNHEQAAKYLLDGTPNNAAGLAANSRIKYYPLPAPGGFYSGDQEKVDFVGYLRDYYAFEWGDALFVVIDPYWHSSVPVDNVAGSNSPKRIDLWDITLGEEQYQWFKKTLEESDAKYKFVFTHHVLGTGRGGIEEASLYEWGGFGKNGVWEFSKMRPNWEMPIHQLMVKNNVTIFFQGHDHLFAKQELDGVIYQSLPNPADDTYTAFNSDAYKMGDVLPNSGHLRVTVSPEQVKVDYIRSFLPKDEIGGHKNGEIAYSYIVN
jgi:hypothetical protein